MIFKGAVLLVALLVVTSVQTFSVGITSDSQISSNSEDERNEIMETMTTDEEEMTDDEMELQENDSEELTNEMLDYAASADLDEVNQMKKKGQRKKINKFLKKTFRKLRCKLCGRAVKYVADYVQGVGCGSGYKSKVLQFCTSVGGSTPVNYLCTGTLIAFCNAIQKEISKGVKDPEKICKGLCKK